MAESELGEWENHMAIAFWWRVDQEVTILTLEEPIQMTLENMELLVAYAYLHGAHELPDGIGIRTPDGKTVNLLLEVFDARTGIYDDLDDLAENVQDFYNDLKVDQFASGNIPDDAWLEPHPDPTYVVWGPKF
jgi:hypothetical protein